MSVPVTISGRLSNEPELRFTATGIAMAQFSVVTSMRRRNKDTGAYEDVDASFWNCVAWRVLAENVAECAKGDRVIVTGRAVQEEWEDKATGAKRRGVKIKAEDVGVSILFSPAKSGRMERGATVLDKDPWST